MSSEPIEWILSRPKTFAFFTFGLPNTNEEAPDFLVWVPMKDNKTMSGIQFVTDEKGRKVGVLIDLKKHGAIWEDFWDGLVSESRRKEKGAPLEKIKADLVKRGRLRE